MSDIALWLIPLLILATIAFILLLARYFQQKAEQEIKKLGLALRQFQSERRSLDARLQSYSGRDPEPYRSRSASLREAQAGLRRSAEALEQARIALNERAARLKFNRWRIMLGAPYLWRALGREATHLQDDCSQLQIRLSQASQMGNDLQRLPWQVAQQVRQLLPILQNASELLSSLRSQGMHGDAMEEAARLERKAQTALSQVPRPFLDDDESSLLQEADKESTALVYEVARLNRPLLDELLDKTKRWQAEHVATQARVAEMRQALDELEQTLSSLPSALEIAEEQAALRQMDEIAQNLQASASRLEVESMPLVAQEAEKLRQTARTKNQELQNTQRALASLEALQIELSIGFRDLSLQLAALGARRLHPVQWEVSLEQLARLNRQANALAHAGVKRTPAQIEADLRMAGEISAQQKEFARKTQELEQFHSELSTLLESPEFQQTPQWIQNAHTLAEEAAEYAPENWSHLDDITRLTGEVERLAEQASHLIFGDPGQAVSELDLADRLDETRQWAEDYRRLAARLENVRRRLDDLRQRESQAQAQIEDLRKLLNQVRLIANSNQFLAGVSIQEIDRLLKSAQELEDDLGQPQQGAVEKKSRQAAALAERANDSAERWLDLLNKEIQILLRELAASLSQLEAIARLEDSSVGEARRLLSSEGAHEGAYPTGRNRHSPDEIVLALKRRSTFWQECVVAQKALENVQQLVETHREAGFQRDQSRQQIQAITGAAPQKRVWPPSSTSLEAERQELDELEKEWVSMKERSGRAITLVALYSSLASRYQNLAERLRQSAARRDQEQSLVEDLDADIAEQAQPWEELRLQYQDNPTASREIGEMLAGLDQALEDVEQGYLHGELEYDQVVQQMKSLQRRVRYYQVALDDEHALDASGRVSRRRQSERE